MTIESMQSLGSAFDEGFFLIGLVIFGIEIVKGLFSKSLGHRQFLDTLANVSTQFPFFLVEIFLLSGIYVSYTLIADNIVPWTIPVTGITAILIILMADFVYYWEHRFAHEVRVFWTQHAVHHSSRFMNISVAVRFGPFEGILSALMHLPLLFLGFSAELILFGMLMVQAYQTWIHTELIGRLGFLEQWINTPANHRVHHGCDEKYIDKNYGGILIIWDRLFGTYQTEEETPRYGLTSSFSSVNPLKVWVSELPDLYRELKSANSTKQVLALLFSRPGPPSFTLNKIT